MQFRRKLQSKSGQNQVQIQIYSLFTSHQYIHKTKTHKQKTSQKCVAIRLYGYYKKWSWMVTPILAQLHLALALRIHKCATLQTFQRPCNVHIEINLVI